MHLHTSGVFVVANKLFTCQEGESVVGDMRVGLGDITFLNNS